MGVEQWAELRREHFVRGVAIKELARRTGLSRNTIRAALRSAQPPRYRRESAGSKLDPFKPEIHRLLGEEEAITGQRIRELIAPLGFDGGKTIVDDYLREVRPRYLPRPRTFQRTLYRPGEMLRPTRARGRPRRWTRSIGIYKRRCSFDKRASLLAPSSRLAQDDEQAPCSRRPLSTDAAAGWAPIARRRTPAARPTQQRAVVPSGAPGLLLCQSRGLPCAPGRRPERAWADAREGRASYPEF